MGLSRYFSGVECRRGHLSERLVSDGHCVECNAIKNAKRVGDSQFNAKRREKRAENREEHIAKDRAYRAKNRDSDNARQRAAYAANLDESRKRQRDYYYKNLEKKQAYARETQSARYKRNPAPMKAYARKRNLEERRATPAWFGEFDKFVWEEAYSLAALRNEVTGVKWHADHMIPLQARSANGLHVWNNCQVIPAKLNRAKSNKMVLTSPCEWIGYINVSCLS